MFALFNPNIYEGGALVLYALHKEIGAQAFAKLEREWALRNEYRNVTTDDYIDLASKVARRNMRPFLEAWIYGDQAPPLPGAEAARMSAAEQARVESGSGGTRSCWRTVTGTAERKGGRALPRAERPAATGRIR